MGQRYGTGYGGKRQTTRQEQQSILETRKQIMRLGMKLARVSTWRKRKLTTPSRPLTATETYYANTQAHCTFPRLPEPPTRDLTDTRSARTSNSPRKIGFCVIWVWIVFVRVRYVLFKNRLSCGTSLPWPTSRNETDESLTWCSCTSKLMRTASKIKTKKVVLKIISPRRAECARPRVKVVSS